MREKLKIERLRNYYNTRIYSKPMPVFDQLSDSKLKQIEGTYGFAMYNLSTELSNLKAAVYRKVSLTKFRDLFER